jgi:hypothetical protein
MNASILALVAESRRQDLLAAAARARLVHDAGRCAPSRPETKALAAAKRFVQRAFARLAPAERGQALPASDGLRPTATVETAT